MGVSAAVFESNGQRSTHFIPGIFSRVDTSGGAGVGVGIEINSAIIGESFGGEPGKALLFTDENQAKAVLVGGPLLDAVLFALDPSSDGAPSFVIGVRMNNAIKATITLLNTATDVIDVEDRDFGVSGNQIQVAVENGTTTGKKVSIQKATELEIFDDVTAPFFDLIYTGAGTPAVLDITATNLTTAITGGPGGENLNIVLSTLNTIQDLVDTINAAASGVYTATITGNSTETLDKLDLVAAQNILVSYSVVGINFAIIDTLSTESAIVSAKFPSGGSRLIPDNIAFAFLSGGAENTPTDASQLTSVLSGLLTEDLMLLALISSDAALKAVFKTHIAFANGVFGKAERVGFVGEDFGATKSVAITTAKADAVIEDEGAIAVMANGFTRRDRFGVIKNWGSIYTAAVAAGLKSSLSVTEAITGKRINSVDSEFKFLQAEEIDLIKSGVTSANITAGVPGYRFTRSVSSFQGSNLIENEHSMKLTTLFVIKTIRNFVEARHKGFGILDDLKLVDIVNDVTEQLIDLKASRIIVINPNEADLIKREAFRDVKAIAQTADQAAISFFARIPAPFNFGFITFNVGIIVNVGG